VQTCPKCGESNADAARFCQGCGNPLAPPVEEEVVAGEVRKTASLVFCDLTGSTALGEKMDPEALRRIVTRYFNDMKQVLTSHGGTVEKFIGDAVMAVFGVPMIHEDDALRAVRAAVEMQQAIEDMNLDLELEWGVGLKARIGVNTGEVIAGDPSAGHGFVSGDAVNVAARLEQAAPPGEVLIGEPTYRLVRDAVKVESVEPLELKGKSERVPAYKLVEVIPHALGTSRRLDSPLVGRERELTLLTETFDRAVGQGSCELITIFGAAGVGKSRLTAEFIASVEDRVSVAHGGCLPYGEGITYWPIAEAIKGLCGITEADTAAQAQTKIGAFLGGGEEAALVGERIAAAIGLTEATPDTQETFWAVRKFLEALSRERPLLVIFDDIQWAETTMLDLIEYLAGFSQGAPMLLLCPARKDLLDTRPSWGMTSTVIRLEPLTPDDVARLVENLLGQAQLPQQVGRRIVEAAEGNPLYAEEILRMMMDDGLLVQEDGNWHPAGDVSDLSIPPSIQALVAARLDRLGRNEQAVTQRASVIGRTFWWGAVSELSPEALRPRVGHYLQTLVHKELVLPDQSSFAGEDAFKFGHIMIRDSAYLGMPKELRSELHEQFATWLEKKAGDRIIEYEEILGYHLEQAFKLREELGASDERTEELGQQAVERLASAGQRAFARADMPAAANLLGRAARLLPIRDPQRSELSLNLSDALMEIGELKEAGTVIEQITKVATATKDERTQARASLQLCLLRSYTDVEGWKEQALAETERLIPVLEGVSDDLALARAHWLRAQVHWDDYRLVPARKALEDALSHARKAEAKHHEAKILASLSATLFWGPTPVSEAIATCEKIIEQGGGNRYVQATCRLRMGGLQAMTGNFVEARRLSAAARSVLGELGQSLTLAYSSQDAGMVELLAGDAVAAEKEFRSGLEALEAMGEKAFLATSAALLARALYEQDALDDAESFTRASEEAAGDDPAIKAEWGPTRAKVLARRGQLDEAETLAREALAIASEPDDVLVRGHALEGVAEVLFLADRKADAKPLLEEALALYEKKQVAPLIEKVRAALAST
jgi:predicted ATPase/class 3 adenylate cyclase